MAQRQTSASTRFVEVAVVAILFWGMAAVAFWQFNTSFQAQDANSGGPFDNAAMFPRLIAWGLVALGAVQIGYLVLKWLFRRGDDHDINGGLIRPRPDDEPLAKLTLRALASAVFFVLYLFVLTPVGYAFSTPVLIAAMAMVLGAKWWMAAFVGLVTTVLVGIVFATILNVVLPVGRLGLPVLF